MSSARSARLYVDAPIMQNIDLSPTVEAFGLYRTTDVTGISGTGLVAVGARFSDGTCVLRWNSASTVVWDSLEALEATHCYEVDGVPNAEVVFVDRF